MLHSLLFYLDKEIHHIVDIVMLMLSSISNATLTGAIQLVRSLPSCTTLILMSGAAFLKGENSRQSVRLVANCILAYNAIILNTIYEKMLKEGVSQNARISPIAWAHIAFTGKYNFKKSNGEIDVAAMVNAMEKHLRQYFWRTT